MNGLVLLVATALLLAVGPVAASPPAQSTAFTYQGNLNASGSPASGNYDLSFTLFDASTGGNQVGNTISLPQYPVSNGVFTADLDFPGAFTGTQLWLEITVGTQTLSPRQPVNSVPVAAFALSGNAGPPGPPGQRGYTSLIGLTPESPGQNCTIGGTKMTAGADVNGNGVLDPSEITATSYLCNVSNTTVPPGCNAYPLSWANTAIDFAFVDPDPSATSSLPNAGALVTLAAHPLDPNTCGVLPVTPFSYQWSMLSAPAGSKAVLSSSTDATPTIVPDVPGNYFIQAIVTDAFGNRTPHGYLSLVTSPCGTGSINIALSENTPQSFSAIASAYDNDGTKCPSRFATPLSYAWSVLAAPVPSTWQFSAPASAGTRFVPSVPGYYTLSVKVSDANGHANSIAYPFSLAQGTTTTILQSSLNPAALGQSVTFVAQPQWNAQAPYFLSPPTGSITFLDGTTGIPGCIAIPLSSSNTQASCTTSALTTGPHSISATYLGDVTYQSSTSAALGQTVN